MENTTTTLTHPQLLRCVQALWNAPGRKASLHGTGTAAEALKASGSTAGMPIFIWGSPGGGKTSAFEQLAWQLGYDCCEGLALNSRQPEDVGGYAVPNRTRDAMLKIPDSWVARVNNAERSAIIFDEYSTCEDASRAACLRVFSERMAGDTRINGTARMACLANPPDQATNGQDLSPADSNRFFHFEWVGWDVEAFGEWALSGAGAQQINPIDAAAEEKRILARWPSEMARSAALVLGWLRRFPDSLEQTPRGVGPNADKGEEDQLRWPSLRIWEMTMRGLASAKVHGLNDTETDAIVFAALPAGLATKFCAFRRDEGALPLPEEVLDGTVEVELDRRMDRTQTILEMTAGYLVPSDTKDRPKRAKVWWGLARKVMDHKYGGKDFVVTSARMMAKSPEDGGAGLGDEVIPEAESVVTDLYDVLMAERKAKTSS